MIHCGNGIRSEVPRHRFQVAVRDLVPCLGECDGELLRILQEGLRNRRIVQSAFKAWAGTRLPDTGVMRIVRTSGDRPCRQAQVYQRSPVRLRARVGDSD